MDFHQIEETKAEDYNLIEIDPKPKETISKYR
jgi:hypothetical protein